MTLFFGSIDHLPTNMANTCYQLASLSAYLLDLFFGFLMREVMAKLLLLSFLHTPVLLFIHTTYFSDIFTLHYHQEKWELWHNIVHWKSSMVYENMVMKWRHCEINTPKQMVNHTHSALKHLLLHMQDNVLWKAKNKKYNKNNDPWGSCFLEYANVWEKFLVLIFLPLSQHL